MEPREKHRVALAMQAFIFPGAGYFIIGRKLKGMLVVLATCYLLILPLVRFTRTMFALTVPLSARDAIGPGVLKSFPLAWAAHKELILWSLVGVVILWVFGIIDVWYASKREKQGGHHGMHT